MVTMTLSRRHFARSVLGTFLLPAISRAADRPKRKKSEKVTNKHQPEQFKMKTGETWQTTFAHKDVRNRVPWEGDVKMCPRWFIGGYCFANCFHKSSHVKDTDIPADKLAAFKSFLDNIRGD